MKRITTLEALSKAIFQRKAVVVPKSYSFCTPTSACFVMNMQGREILKLITIGMFIYKPIKKGFRK